MSYIFNHFFNEELKENKVTIILPEQDNIHNIYSFSSLGDSLVNLCAGYWAFSLSSTGKTRTIKLIIPSFIYENIKKFKGELPKMSISTERLDELKEQYKLKLQEDKKKKKIEKGFWDTEELKSNKREQRNAVCPYIKIGKSLIKK